jgi:hypothetical protein
VNSAEKGEITEQGVLRATIGNADAPPPVQRTANDQMMPNQLVENDDQMQIDGAVETGYPLEHPTATTVSYDPSNTNVAADNTPRPITPRPQAARQDDRYAGQPSRPKNGPNGPKSATSAIAKPDANITATPSHSSRRKNSRTARTATLDDLDNDTDFTPGHVQRMWTCE